MICWIRSYSEGLNADCPLELSLALLMNRAQARLSLGAFSPALNDCRSALKLSRYRNEKALYRHAKVLYSLRSFDRAFDAFEHITLRFPVNQEAKLELARSSQRVAEQRTGRYMFSDIRTALLRQCPRIDIADYVGPVVFLNERSDTVSTCVAARDIKAGELLFSVKAFESVYLSPGFPSGDTPGGNEIGGNLIFHDTRTGITEGEAEVLLTRSVCQKLFLNPELIQDFFRRCGSTWLDEPTSQVIILDGHPVVDM